MASTLSALAVGSTLSLKVDGADQEFLIVHQGSPDPDLYDASCDGTWLMMKNLYAKDSWGTTNLYSSSSVHSWLNGFFLSLLDSSIQPLIRNVKIPYAEGGTVHSGADGLETKAFLLSACEMGFHAEDRAGMQAEGQCLAYFEGFSAADSRRIATLNGAKTWYWTRSPYTEETDQIWVVVSVDGNCTYRGISSSYGIRPVLILPSTLSVDDSGHLLPNTAPSITSPSGTSGANLGIRNNPFVLEYTASDAEGADLDLTEQLDAQTTRTLTAPSGTLQHFEALKDSAVFLPLANGAHTLTITASDGMDSSTLSMTFTRAVTSASLTLTQPMTAQAPISVAFLAVEGVIPADADYTVEVTNNALDDTPVWQDVTSEVRQGQNILFDHRTAEKSPAFNFRIHAARGASGTGGSITGVTGAFQ